MAGLDRIVWLTSLDPADREAILSLFSEEEREELRWYWPLWARPEQLPPGGDWSSWLICAGRGFGKTRAGAEWVREIARDNPDARIALIGASLPETRSIMVEGESGILAVSPPYRRPTFEPSLRRITWPNGAQAFLYSAAEAESLRGPQHSHAFGAGAERTLRQRGPCLGRCIAPSRGEGHRYRATGRSLGWRGIHYCGQCDRGLCGADGADCPSATRAVAFRHTGCRDAGFRLHSRSGTALPRRVEYTCILKHAGQRRHHRCRSKGRNRPNPEFDAGCRFAPLRLTEHKADCF